MLLLLAKLKLPKSELSLLHFGTSQPPLEADIHREVKTSPTGFKWEFKPVHSLSELAHLPRLQALLSLPAYTEFAC